MSSRGSFTHAGVSLVWITFALLPGLPLAIRATASVLEIIAAWFEIDLDFLALVIASVAIGFVLWTLTTAAIMFVWVRQNMTARLYARLFGEPP